MPGCDSAGARIHSAPLFFLKKIEKRLYKCVKL
nr:MAG TPA: hypothetical protein [Caudoviricetes sp.]